MHHSQSHKDLKKKAPNISIESFEPKHMHHGSLTTSHQLEMIKEGQLTKTPYAENLVNKVKTNQHKKNHSLDKLEPLSKGLNYVTSGFSRTTKNKEQGSTYQLETENTERKGVVQYTIPSMVRIGNSSERDFSNNQSINSSFLPMITNPSYQIIHDINYALQKDYIDQNPHFNKYFKSVFALDRKEASKVSLSRELYYYPEQMEINEKFMKEVQSTKKLDQLVTTKLIKENSPEQIELMKDKSTYLKIYCFDKGFPMTVNIERSFGTFEIFVSKSHSKPDLGTCEYYIRNEHFQVDYSADQNVRFVYFKIYAVERLQMTLTALFTPKNEAKKPKPLPKIDLKKPNKKAQDLKKRKVYEFFHENMGREEILNFQQVIQDIRNEKKEKLMTVNHKNVIMDNMALAREYGDYKQHKFFESVQKQAIMFHNNKVNRENLEAQKEKKRLFNKHRHELKILEREWRHNEERRKFEENIFQREWMIMLAMLTMANKIYNRKRSMIILRKWKNVQNDSARIIQQKIRSFLNYPLLVRYEDRENNIKYKEDIKIQTKIMVKLYESFNAIALSVNKQKRARARNLVRDVICDATPMFSLSDAMNAYLENVVKIQNRWRSYKMLFEARMYVFKVSWQRFCMGIIDEESKKKKKKQTELISRIREQKIEYHARIFIKKKIRAFLEAVYNFMSIGEKKDDTHHETEDTLNHDTDFFKNTKSSFNEDPKLTSRTMTKEGNSSKGKMKKRLRSKTTNEMDSSTSKANFLKLRPTKEELKEIFDTIVQEIKAETGN